MNLKPSGDSEISYSLDIHGEKEINPELLSKCIGELVEGKKVVTFGEEHNLNVDGSFSEVLKYEELIFHIYREIRNSSSLKEIFHYFNENSSIDLRNIFLDFLQFAVDFLKNDVESMSCSSSRVFSCLIIPECSKKGFKDLVLEGYDEYSPEKNYKLSKDKIGYLMIMIASLFCGVKLHGAYNSDFIFDATGIARAFEEKVDTIIKDNPEAKVFTYNGGVHNMTVPIEGEYKIFGATINLKELSFAPHFGEKYGKEYISIDLVDSYGSKDESNHYSFLRGKSNKYGIMLIDHSKGQKAIVLPDNPYKINEVRDKVMEIL